ncbi:MAG: molybdopterin molybdotransferase MoeA [Rhodospirillaceae bacterium]|jgi:molybdopterin molybdotransferase|nr:molybdopterin molybdotransferase MoeA [Rhodospirillales bacterium]MBT3906221.1 molybdopterin molybdotransferase MoeA [Rhodospirillaceae bacterium]MBT4700051.1 molybdopterin molybdotransferase MoeA [Rhodospirillaceae bacterium]MBT5034703.1 molybdopterin molybdotransferase MoeA [Rhodospirillaceae bacterium]MBT6221496.1 molybdopterin molybdotransferase MoeA [Rhodospirillaceae bacterium]
MTELRDDCFELDGNDLTPLSDALALLAERLSSIVETETVPLSKALNRALAEDVTAPRNVPPHNNAAVDGYAVYFDDLNSDEETRLNITGRIAAGHPLGRPARAGEALRIFTGAPVPEGPETIFMQEDCVLEGDVVVLKPGIKKGANYRFAGEDVKKGSVILTQGTRLRPQEIGLAASVGRSELKVFKPLRVAVFSTGDEVRDPSGAAPDGCIFDANRYTVMGLLNDMGTVVTDLGILPDQLGDIQNALEKAATSHDLLITSGGVSLGEEDHVKDAVQALGEIQFWRLAIKPGRPIAMGKVGTTAFIGLPGNPVASMVTFMRIARPIVLLLGGHKSIAPSLFQVRAGFDFKKKQGRREWVRARLERGQDGILSAIKHPQGGAGVLTSMVESDGLIELAEDQGPFEEGFMVDFLPFSEVTR